MRGLTIKKRNKIAEVSCERGRTQLSWGDWALKDHTDREKPPPYKDRPVSQRKLTNSSPQPIIKTLDCVEHLRRRKEKRKRSEGLLGDTDGGGVYQLHYYTHKERSLWWGKSV